MTRRHFLSTLAAFGAATSLPGFGIGLPVVSSTQPKRCYKLKATWSEECDQNLQAMYNIKAEAVLLAAFKNAP